MRDWAFTLLARAENYAAKNERYFPMGRIKKKKEKKKEEKKRRKGKKTKKGQK